MNRFHELLKTILISTSFLLMVNDAVSSKGIVNNAYVFAETENGTLRGFKTEGVNKFLGIPYAKQPIGDLRWRPPEDIEGKWLGVRDSMEYGNACPQPVIKGFSDTEKNQNEACLYLNIWSPELEIGEKLPVMVWIHGGANRLGSGSNRYYNGADLARKDVVVVTINYRLGYLGYFSHPSLDSESAGGNLGLMDQVKALKWVQKNIGNFGGDKNRVTVFGESAGALNILYLLTSQLSEIPFNQAIIQSAGAWKVPDRQGKFRSQIYDDLKHLGVSEASDKKLLRSIDVDDLVSALPWSNSSFGPFIDRTTVDQSPLSVIAEKKQLKIPLIIGSNSWEGSLLKIFKYEESVFSKYDSLKEIYAQKNQSFSELIYRDIVFSAPARWIAREHSKVAPTWLYYFDYVRDSKKSHHPGAAHGAEIAYIFRSLKDYGNSQEPSESDVATMNVMSDCWVSFAENEMPLCKVDWPIYTTKTEHILWVSDKIISRVHPELNVLKEIEKYINTNNHNESMSRN